MISQLALDDVSFQTIRSMGFLNLVWLLLLGVGFIAWRAKKIGVTSVGKNEWGILEILGFPLIPIPFGIFPFVKGLFHVKEVSTAPERVDFSLRQEVNERVLGIVITVLVTATTKPPAGLSRLSRFTVLRRDLIAALYGAYDENVDDAENPERINQTRDILEAGTRQILRTHKSIEKVSLASFVDLCGEDLRIRFGEYMTFVLVREDAPTESQQTYDAAVKIAEALMTGHPMGKLIEVPSADSA